jgi:signal transduction histidine kinase
LLAESLRTAEFWKFNFTCCLGINVSDLPSAQLVRLQEENAALKKRLSEMQRMTALGESVSTTTHEFNNVLMTIINYAKMGIRYEDKATRDKAFAKIDKAGARAAKITNAVLGMARNRSEQLEPTSLPKLIEESMVLLEREMQKYRIAVECEFEDGLPDVPVIGNQIQQVLMNLLINARQAMKDGGRLIIRLKKNQQSQTVDLSIRDFGPGIEQAKLRRIFEPFYSTKQGPDETGKGGTGVGLSTCKNIIDAHGGKIRVDSTVGRGTCFTLMLPTKTTSTIPKAHGLASVVAPANASVPSSIPSTNS